VSGALWDGVDGNGDVKSEVNLADDGQGRHGTAVGSRYSDKFVVVVRPLQYVVSIVALQDNGAVGPHG
jgi:hypothetical protein